MVAGGSSSRTKIGAAAGALLLTLCFVLLGAGPARADGALPGSLGILLPSDRPQEIVLATNFGMMISEDGGGSWLWTCEQASNSMGYLYSAGPSPRDRGYGLSPEQGLAFSDDETCTWQRAGGALDTSIASDFFVDPTNADRVLAVAATKDSNGDIGPQSVYGSMDGGTTFGAAPLYTAPATENVVGIEIARGDPKVVYLAMYSYPGVRHPVLARSGDGGQTWSTTDVEAALGANEFRILAVDPDDPDLLYLRVVMAGREELWVTRDAGQTFTQGVVVQGGSLSAFARLASGVVLVAGLTSTGGLATAGVAYRSTDKGMTFSPWVLCPQPHIVGLAERAGVVYLAGKNYSDGWALATSTDEGVTIHPLATYDQVRGVKPCAQATCASTCTFEVMAAVWTSDVCTGALIDGGVLPPGPSSQACPMDASADAPAPPATSGCRCAAADPGRRGEVFGPFDPNLVPLALLAGVTFARRRRPRL